ncbi:hypothetical protein QJS10_CPB18g00288 [Acorus calamus]|uniref:Uncharacterized protein n=1 Tax=Acorus calamus TaxID=4465 RepID=A0AAV9CL95_ACOCL|nr:hypothetical protein QJS10_CPB18g00288 [Acorus calamus]
MPTGTVSVQERALVMGLKVQDQSNISGFVNSVRGEFSRCGPFEQEDEEANLPGGGNDDIPLQTVQRQLEASDRHHRRKQRWKWWSAELLQRLGRGCLMIGCSRKLEVQREFCWKTNKLGRGGVAQAFTVRTRMAIGQGYGRNCRPFVHDGSNHRREKILTKRRRCIEGGGSCIRGGE